MDPLTIGIDIVEIDRLARVMARTPEFGLRYFTAGERARCSAVPGLAARRFAGCFAVKEALLKALGHGVLDGIALADIEVVGDGRTVEIIVRDSAARAVGSRHAWASAACDARNAWAAVVLGSPASAMHPPAAVAARSTMRLHVVITSTRPSRKGPAIARWVVEQAQAHGKFEVELVDLAEVALPAMDEPAHPRLRQYEHEHTKAWSASVDKADAFVFVTPEYNYSAPPALVNALDYLFWEWHYKPAGFVCYGGISGGLRGVQMARLMVSSLRMMPLPETVPIPSFTDFIDAHGAFVGNEAHTKGTHTMLDELARWTTAMATLRKA